MFFFNKISLDFIFINKLGSANNLLIDFYDISYLNSIQRHYNPNYTKLLFL